jgi:Tol biopolymer transport system component
MNQAARWTGVALAAVLAGEPAEAQTTERVSVSSAGVQGSGNSQVPSISSDGRCVAFASNSSDLVAGDTNFVDDVFVRDRQTGTTERVSVSSSGVQGDSYSGVPAISADGRFVAFHSLASNLVAGDLNGLDDIFVRDRQSGTTELASVATGGAQGNSWCGSPSISADGRFVAFESLASNLVAGDTNMHWDIFVRDRLNGTTERVSVATGGTEGNSLSVDPALSADGRCVAFQSLASNLVANDGNAWEDIFVRDRLSGTTEIVSVATGGGQGNFTSSGPSISADGRLVVFWGYASNLVPGDTNASADVFVHDRQSGVTERVSIATGGAQGGGDSGTLGIAISADGRCVAFQSHATNLIANDANGYGDVFVHDLQSGTTERMSVGAAGAEADDSSTDAAISADGRFMAFQSLASNLVAGDTNLSEDVFVHDRGGPPPPPPFCLGDGSAGACPCANNGAPGRGCQNSASTGGARLNAAGSSSLSNDTLVLSASGELPHALSVFLQGSTAVAPLNFGDGLRCASGFLKRLYIANASGGVVSVPQPGDPSVSARSAAVGDTLTAGATRYYQTYYRDPLLAFCPEPSGNSWNISSGLSVTWSQ